MAVSGSDPLRNRPFYNHGTEMPSVPRGPGQLKMYLYAKIMHPGRDIFGFMGTVIENAIREL